MRRSPTCSARLRHLPHRRRREGGAPADGRPQPPVRRRGRAGDQRVRRPHPVATSRWVDVPAAPRPSTSRPSSRIVLKLRMNFDGGPGPGSLPRSTPREEALHFAQMPGRPLPSSKGVGVRFVQIWSGNDNSLPCRNWDSCTRTRKRDRPLPPRYHRRGPPSSWGFRATRGSTTTLIRVTTELGRSSSSQGGKCRDQANPSSCSIRTGSAAAASRAAYAHGESDVWATSPLDRIGSRTTVYDGHPRHASTRSARPNIAARLPLTTASIAASRTCTATRIAAGLNAAAAVDWHFRGGDPRGSFSNLAVTSAIRPATFSASPPVHTAPVFMG